MLSLKPIIFFALVVMLGMIAFNWMISNHSHESVEEHPNISPSQNQSASDSDKIADKPLGQQPKAILDKANSEIEQAEKLQNQQMAQLDAAN